jgi:mono/diheme cytochrome c family protein
VVVGILTGNRVIARQTTNKVSAEKPKTVWDGVYTEEQSGRGQLAYDANCSRCHSSTLDERLRGEGFMDRWREGSLASLFFRMKNDMPQNKPGSLPEAAYLDILAHVLKSNGMPAGGQELNAQNVAGIRVQKKSGPEPLPDFSMVRVVGCLSKESGNWVLSHASEPERTTEVEKSTSAELEAARQQTLGEKTFRLQNLSYLGADFNPESHTGHKMHAKGTLMRLPGGDRIQLTSMEMIDASCAP